jgi:DNA repair protein RecO (recombination protein O)
MIHKTRGVVFRFTRFGETSIVVTIFTEAFGLQSYIVNSVRNARAKNKIALYQPLTLLDLVVYHKAHASLLRIREARCLYPYRHIGQDMIKTCIALFINEVLNKTVKEESHAGRLCGFVIESLIALDNAAQPENFHLVFLVRLSRLLGFGAYRPEDLFGGVSPDDALLPAVGRLLEADYHTPPALPAAERQPLLHLLLRFFGAHIESLGELKSIPVLRTVLR